MSDLFLGIIAGAVALMAAIQVAAIVVAARAARSVRESVRRLEQDVRPIVASLQSMSAEAARASALAAAQLERADQVLADVSRRVDRTAEVLHTTIVTPAREVYAVIQGLLAALGTVRGGDRQTRGEPPRKRPSPAEEEDPLFIG